MKVSEICELVRSGEITLDVAGHHVNATKERFLERYDRNVAMANGANDGKWSPRENETPEKVDAGMREFYQRHLDREVNQEETLGSGMGDGEYCFGCGEKNKWVLTGKKLQLRQHYVEDATDRFGIREINDPVDFICPFHIPMPFKGEIKVTSKLLIANFFREIEDAPEDEQWSEKWSLNSFAGRQRVAEYKAARNVAYGQMGNTSISIYINDAKDSIIIGPNCHPAEYKEYDTNEEYEAACSLPAFPGYEQVGSIILDVWRWEATDLNTIGEDKYPEIAEDHQYRGMVEIDVPHGTWTFEHFHDSKRWNKDNEDYLYAKLELKKSV